MPANTSPDNIIYPVVGDQIAPLEAVFQDLAESTQEALDARQVYSYVWADATARAAQTGMAAGSTGYQINTAASYVYSGSEWYIPRRTWLLQGLGLNPIPNSETLVTGSSVTVRVPQNSYIKVHFGGRIQENTAMNVEIRCFIDGAVRGIPILWEKTAASIERNTQSGMAFYQKSTAGNVTVELRAIASLTNAAIFAQGWLSAEVIPFGEVN